MRAGSVFVGMQCLCNATHALLDSAVRHLREDHSHRTESTDTRSDSRVQHSRALFCTQKTHWRTAEFTRLLIIARTEHAQHKVTLTWMFCTHQLEERQLAQRGRALLTNIPRCLLSAKAKRASKHPVATHKHTHTDACSGLGQKTHPRDKHDAERHLL